MEFAIIFTDFSSLKKNKRARAMPCGIISPGHTWQPEGSAMQGCEARSEGFGREAFKGRHLKAERC